MERWRRSRVGIETRDYARQCASLEGGIKLIFWLGTRLVAFYPLPCTIGSEGIVSSGGRSEPLIDSQPCLLFCFKSLAIISGIANSPAFSALAFFAFSSAPFSTTSSKFTIGNQARTNLWQGPRSALPHPTCRMYCNFTPVAV